MIFGLAEHDRAHGTGETAGSVANGIVETDCDLVSVFLVLVDHQKRPVAVGPKDRIRRDQQVPYPVGDIAGRGKQAMLAIARL